MVALTVPLSPLANVPLETTLPLESILVAKLQIESK